MSMPFKAAVRGVLALAVLALMSTALSGQAEAQTRTCIPQAVNSTQQVTICVEFTKPSPPLYSSDPYALAGFSTASSVPPVNFWAGLYRCHNSTGPECVLISASKDFQRIDGGYPSPYKYQIATSSKPYSFGHTYKACMTLGQTVNFCTRETT